ncbi:MAG: tautomerase family protein [Methanoregula sp.]|nr:tautomerase family protein [Methanoregula sp.]
MPVIILKVRRGFSQDQKRRIAEEFTDTLVSVGGVKPELVTIFIEEHEPGDIANAGKLRCD